MNEQIIISIDEFRSIAGIASANFSDTEILEMIRQLDIMAQIYIKQVATKPDKENDEYK
jgi:hypothetical protein